MRQIGHHQGMTNEVNEWSCLHFSLANPRDSSQGDLPKLLRRLASEIEERRIEALDILDLTVSQEITDEGPWWSATLYWSPEEAEAEDEPVPEGV